MYILLKKGNTCNNKVFKEEYMKRKLNLKSNKEKNVNDKILLYSIIGISVVAILIIALLIYSNKISNDVKNETMTLGQMTEALDRENKETESASTEFGKTVEESKNESNTNVNNVASNEVNTKATNTSTENKAVTNTNKNVTTNKKINTTSNEKKEEKKEVKEEKVELKFAKPVEGEISKEYAQENLVYSETLQEWVTHSGIDIKADKTTVVKSAEKGTVKTIKNDPRYGLTIVVEHANGYKTVYANLLTSEFVVEGEKVEKGQSLGTVGNTAVFEIADEPHLHFEILKDSMPVNPSDFIK